MLHIIWGILKIIGIVIGLLPGVLLCTVLALLLVPVRYRVGAVKKGEKQQLNISLSWMLRMVSVAVSGGREEETVVLIRLFGFRLPVFGGKKPEKDRRKKNKRKSSGDSKSGQQKQENPDKNRKNDRLPDAEITDNIPDILKTSGEDAEKAEKRDLPEEPEKEGLAKRQKTTEEKQNFSDKESDESPDSENTGQTKRMRRDSRAFRSWIRKCSAAVHKIPDRIKALGKRIKKMRKRLLSLRKKPAQIKKAFHRLCEKPAAFFRMIEEYEIKELFGSLYGEALYLLEHYKPRRIRGYLRFGAGDPALTGVLTGLIYMLLPARADQFSVMPDFYETVFETEAIFTGYIRSVHLGRTALHAFRDKRVRRVFRERRIKNG